MRKIVIHEPIWKTRSVGLAKHLLTTDIQVVIDWKNKDGIRLYPDPFFITREKAMEYPTQRVRGVVLVIIPIADMETKDDDLGGFVRKETEKKFFCLGRDVD